MALLIERSVAEELPGMVREALSVMRASEQQAFLDEYARRSKSAVPAYLLLLVGLHYAYVRRWGLLVLFWLTAFGFGFWWLVDWVRLYFVVRDYNQDIAVAVLRDMKAIGY